MPSASDCTRVFEKKPVSLTVGERLLQGCDAFAVVGMARIRYRQCLI